MPAKFLMSWNERDKAWYKMYKGQRNGNYVTAAELGCEPTKLASYAAANEWWLKRLATLQGTAKPKYKSPFEAPSEIELVTDPAYGIAAPFTSRTPKKQTIAANLDEFLALVKSNCEPQSYKEIRDYLSKLKDSEFFAGELNVASITEETVSAHRKFLNAGPQSPAYKNKRLGFFRRFVGWLAEEKRVSATPANLYSKLHRFKEPPPSPKKWNNVAEVIEALPQTQKLWAMLGLNCGMTQADLGELTWEQIDLGKKTLSRRRTKLRNVPNAPNVTYPLWFQTVELLKKLPHRSGLVFRTETGNSMYDPKYVGDDMAKKDLFSTYWGRLKPRPKISLGKFRNIGATSLKTKAIYRGFVDLYLANVPSGIGDRHYAAESDAPFFEAVNHIRETIFGEEK